MSLLYPTVWCLALYFELLNLSNSSSENCKLAGRNSVASAHNLCHLSRVRRDRDALKKKRKEKKKQGRPSASPAVEKVSAAGHEDNHEGQHYQLR